MTAFLLPAALAAAIAIAASAGAGTAKPDPRLGAIEQRQAEMKRLGASMKLLVGFSKGETVDTAKVKAAGKTVRGVSQRLHRFWPKGTMAGVGKSKARPEIWSDQAAFRRRIAELRIAAIEMDRATASADPARVGLALGPLGGSCRSCHTSFQVKN